MKNNRVVFIIYKIENIIAGLFTLCLCKIIGTLEKI